MTEVYLHVGLPKTATTTLQESLFNKHSQIYCLGKKRKATHKRESTSKQAYEFLRPILFIHDEHFNLDKQRSIFQQKILPEAAGKKALLASWESLGRGNSQKFETMIKRLDNSCGGAKVIISIRNPYTWLPSHYLQNLRGQFIQKNRHFMPTRPYTSFEEWLEIKADSDLSLKQSFSYIQNIQIASKLLGKENVCVLVYEDLKNNSVEYFQKLSDFMGIDFDETLELTKEKHLHARLSKQNIERMAAIDCSCIKRLIWRFSTLKIRSAMLYSSQTSIPASVEVPPVWQRKIAIATEDGHDWIMKEYGLNLRQYGYPCRPLDSK